VASRRLAYYDHVRLAGLHEAGPDGGCGEDGRLTLPGGSQPIRVVGRTPLAKARTGRFVRPETCPTVVLRAALEKLLGPRAAACCPWSRSATARRLFDVLDLRGARPWAADAAPAADPSEGGGLRPRIPRGRRSAGYDKALLHVGAHAEHRAGAPANRGAADRTRGGHDIRGRGPGRGRHRRSTSRSGRTSAPASAAAVGG